MAHALGENLRDNPEDILREPATVPIWERYISGYGQTDGEFVGRVVLRHIALFEKFGARAPVQSEAEFIAKLVATTAPSISQAQFFSVVAYYRQRRILQGDRTLRIVPPALRIHLWTDWWNNYGASASITTMMNGMPKSLHAWFMRSFIYAHGSEAASDVVRAILDPVSGLFSSREFFVSESGSAFINILAEADPANTLALLRARFLGWNDDEIAALDDKPRQNLAWALEKIAVWKDHFRYAAKLLLRLSFGDESTNANNAKGNFGGLFSPNGGATEATLVQRVTLAKELLSSASEFERSMGLFASQELFNVNGAVRMVNVEYQGLRPEIEFWRAKLWSDLIDPWREAMSELRRTRVQSNAAWRLKVDMALLVVIENLARTNVLHDELLSSLSELLACDENYEKIINLVMRLIRFPSAEFPEEFSSALKSLASNLVGTSFSERLRRYVLVSVWEDDYAEMSDGEGPIETVANIRLGLAQEAVRENIVIQSLPALFSSGAHRVEQFGFDVATAQVNSALDDALLGAAKAGTVQTSYLFLSGFLRGVFGIDTSRWERLAETLLETPIKWIVLAVACSGMTERIFDSILTLYQNESVGAEVLTVLSFSPTKDHISIENFRRLLAALLGRRDNNSYRFIVEIAERSLCRADNPDTADELLAFSILTDAGALANRTDNMQEHHWNALAKRFRVQFPERDEEFLSLLINKSDSYHGIGAHGHVSQIASDICKDMPSRAWPIVAKELLGDKLHLMLQWLTERSYYGRNVTPAISHFLIADIFNWIDVEPGVRALIVADAFVPSLEDGAAGDLTRRFIERYVDMLHVGEGLIYKFFSGSWYGSRSRNFANKRELARKWLGETESPKIQDWLALLIEHLNTKIEESLIWEERMF